jgi:signal peptidase I
LIVYSYGGNENLLIKIVKGLPGDKFSLQKTEGGWHILINGKVLKNSENKPYLLDERSYRMLSLYERDYKGVIPENAYLILGNLVSGTLDSTSFGLVGKQDILGKAIKE